MKLLLLCSTIIAITQVASAEMVMMPIGDETGMLTLVRGNNEFAMDLYSAVCEMNDDDNIFFSPYSISMVLGMTYNGASGSTAFEMASVLHFDLPVEALNREFQLVTEMLNLGDLSMERGDPFTLAISNGLWVQNGYELLNSFVTAVTGYYSASVENLDFAGDAEGSREVINSWVAESTMDKILDLIPRGVLGADTRVVLTNAVYFKASWRHPFDAHATSDGRFILPNGSAVVVPMMTNTEHYGYAFTEEWSAVALDYAGGDAGMLIIMPSGDMEEFQEDFNAETLDAIGTSMTSRNVHLTMPGFEFTRSMPLGAILISLGMESAFGPDANFSGFTGNPDLYISEVLHKAFVKVDEEGTEAAAATAVVMNMLSMPETPIEMNINRPFIFIIQDNPTGSIVFMGRMMDPTTCRNAWADGFPDLFMRHYPVIEPRFAYSR